MKVEIKELLLRITDFSPEEAEQLGTEVARRVADNLPVGEGSRYIDAVDLHLSIAGSESRAQLVEKISTSILKKIV